MANSNATASANGGIGFFGLLAIVFITLKLLGVINWSWWLVLLPAYGPILFVLGVILIALIAIIAKEMKRSKR